MTTSFDVRFWAISRRERTLPYEVRWRVSGRVRSRSFLTKTLADGFRSRLMAAARQGEPFDERTGLPRSLSKAENGTTWFEHACSYVDMKWPSLAAKSRKSTAESLATVTPELVSASHHAPSPPILRRALYAWAFNPGARGSAMPADVAAALTWVEKSSVAVAALTEPTVIRRALDACARTADGRPAAATTARRKRAVLYNALGYAVELGLLSSNPVDRVQWKAPEVASTVDRRVVANPGQVRALLEAVRVEGRRGEHLVAFFGCLYFAGMRPSEALALRIQDCTLPVDGWGRLELVGSEPRAGVLWTDDGRPREVRGLKRRGQAETRSVPVPTELVILLRDHVARFGVAEDGRLFRSERGGPLQETAYGAVWRRARGRALTGSQAASPLARRPYDLRHAAVSLWLNAGVPATEVARRVGHGVAVLLSVYANCVDGQEPVANARIDAALSAGSAAVAAGEPAGGRLDAGSEPHGEEPALRKIASQSRASGPAQNGGSDETAGGRARLVADGGGLENRYAG